MWHWINASIVYSIGYALSFCLNYAWMMFFYMFWKIAIKNVLDLNLVIIRDI